MSGDPVKEILKTAFAAGINFLDQAESQSGLVQAQARAHATGELNIPFARADPFLSSSSLQTTRTVDLSSRWEESSGSSTTKECAAPSTRNVLDGATSA